MARGIKMKLFLVQHGEAVSKDIDPQRPLSVQGEHAVGKIATLLGRAGIRAERVLHSGKRRALQTAETLSKALAPAGSCSETSGLAPNDPVEPFAKIIATFTEDTVLVGHLPFMSRLAALLLTGDPEREIVVFQPGSVVCLEGEQVGAFTISWMLRPELLAGD